jgi:hypothetical protein
MSSPTPDSFVPPSRLLLRWRALPPMLRAALVDGLLPLILLAAGALWVGGPLARRPGAVVSNKLFTLEPIDYGATVWFYDWVAQALTRGAPILEPDNVCAPTGTTLGNNFPNWGDAILASPLMAALPFPLDYNLWLATIPVLGGLAAYAALRCLTERRSLALLGAWLFGFNAYSAFQAVLGRPSLALVAILPLCIGALWKATSRRGAPAVAWGLAAGLLAGLALQFFVLYALLAWLLGGLVQLARLLRPHRDSDRAWTALAAVAAVVGVTLTATPYLYQATALQPRFPAPRVEIDQQAGEIAPAWSLGSPEPVEQRLLGPWEPELWAFTWAFAKDRLSGGEAPDPSPGMAEDSLDTMARHALPYTFPWRGTGPRGDPAGVLPLGWLAPLVLLLALAAGPRAWGWMALSLLLWVLCLGPWVTEPEGLRSTPLLVEGRRLRLPLWYLVQVLPEAGSFLKPARLFPGFLFSLVVTLTLSLDTLATRGQGWLSRRWWPTPLVLWPTLAAGLAIASGLAMADLSVELDDTMPYEPWAFHQQLAEDPSPGAIIELPLGIGQTTAGFQAIHGRARAEDHRDAIAAQLAGDPPPEDCYRLPLLEELWDHGRGGSTPARLDPTWIEEARQAGFRWVLVYPEAYRRLQRRGLDYQLEAVLTSLERSLGAPVHQDDDIVAYGLGEPSSDQQ